MNPIYTKIIQLMLGIGLLVNVTQAFALYKWIDDDGNIHYSDHPPSKKGHKELNSHGVIIKSTDAPKTKEELAAEKEANKIAQKKLREEKRIQQAQAAKDRVLLLTFSSEEELDLVRNSRIEVVDSVIRLIGTSITAAETTLARFQNDAETRYLSKGLEVPGGLAQNIEHFTKKIEARRQQQALKQDEKDKINLEFDQDLERYRFLKSQ